MITVGTPDDDFDEDDAGEDFDDDFDDDESDAWLDEIDQPGTEHRRLDALVGDWQTTIKLWDDGPDEEPLEFEGTARRRWMLKGLFLSEQRFENPTGAGVYRSLSFIGYNRMTALYEFVRMNTESTALSMETGRYDPVTDTIRLSGNHSDPATGFIIQTRTEIKVLDPDRHTVVIFVTEEDGLEFKEMEVLHTRKTQ